ncbi:MAG: hypothetical protein G3M70_13545 [Candidatus Nitronauta litoralis]|uniref:Uncharacterized protein n=1 Tax=Candidatus Nitronauta litoralis TaxID=2705533 RepID=A0A7T0BXM2_9BACT|nr:MAG: hypothetical protein G3M70_13545 [Candidatus Nitronauta litoralis]
MKKFLSVLTLAFVMISVSLPAWAVPVFSVDTTQATEDVTAGGIAVLTVSALMFGLSKIRQMLKA